MSKDNNMVDIVLLTKMANPATFDNNITLAATPQFDPKTLDRLDVYVMKVSIQDIDEYQYNPRGEQNEAFQELKDSIENVGLIQMLNVAKNPKTLRFELFNGGNTRLAALNQLYKETGEVNFLDIDCNIHPWVDDDFKKIINHLLENEVRGNLLHVDKAKTIANLEVMFKKQILSKDDEKDSPPGGESLRAENYGITAKFINFLKEKSYSVGSETLSTCRFTSNFLIGNIDYHLSSNKIGTKKIAQIRHIYNNLKRLVKEKDLTDFKQIEFDGDFKSSLKKYNNLKRDFDFYKLVNVVANELLKGYPFNDWFGSDVEALTKIMIAKKPKPVKKDIEKDPAKDPVKVKQVNDKVDIAMADSFLNEHDNKDKNKNDNNNGFDTSLDVVEMRKKSYKLAMKLVSNFEAKIEIVQMEQGSGFLVVSKPTRQIQHLKHWCLFYWVLTS